jgi:hypothetical protein
MEWTDIRYSETSFYYHFLRYSDTQKPASITTFSGLNSSVVRRNCARLYFTLRIWKIASDKQRSWKPVTYEYSEILSFMSEDRMNGVPFSHFQTSSELHRASKCSQRFLWMWSMAPCSMWNLCGKFSPPVQLSQSWFQCPIALFFIVDILNAAYLRLPFRYFIPLLV